MQSKIRVYESGRAELVIVCLGIMCLPIDIHACEMNGISVLT